MSYERDQFQTFVTSASLSTALGAYVTSASLASALGSLGNYVTSESISVAVATDTLTVRGHAGVSATMSAAAVTVATRPVGAVLLGTSSGANLSVFSFSGSWSDFPILELHGHIVNFGGNLPTQIFTDGGTTPILSTFASAVTLGPSAVVALEVRVMGGDAQAHKSIQGRVTTTALSQFNAMTATANTGFVNCLRVTISGTASFAFAALYGWRKT